MLSKFFSSRMTLDFPKQRQDFWQNKEALLIETISYLFRLRIFCLWPNSLQSPQDAGNFACGKAAFDFRSDAYSTYARRGNQQQHGIHLGLGFFVFDQAACKFAQRGVQMVRKQTNLQTTQSKTKKTSLLKGKEALPYIIEYRKQHHPQQHGHILRQLLWKAAEQPQRQRFGNAVSQ